jgi:hypothetical protein
VRESIPSAFPALGHDRCGDACAYRDWLDRYRAWYDRYGSAYGAPGSGGSAPDRGQAHAAAPPPRARPWRDGARLESERARLDPWHGYDSRDGLGNGY